MLPIRWKSAILLSLAFNLNLAAPADPSPPREKPAEKKPRLDLYGDPLPDGARLRLGSTRLRHYNASFAFSSDGKTLLSVGDDDGIVRHWDVTTGKLLRQVLLDPKSRAKGFFRCLTVSGDGKRVVGGDYSALVVWDAATGKRRRGIALERKRVTHVTFSGDGRFAAALISEEGNKTLRVWNTATGETRFHQKPEESFRQFAFSPNGELLALLNKESIGIWSVEKGKEVLRKRTSVDGLAFSPDGKTLAAYIRDKVLLWDTANGKERAVLRKPDSGRCLALKFSADGNTLAAGCNRGLILWDAAARKELRTLPDHFALQLAFSPDGKTLASYAESVFHLWDVATGKALHPRRDHENQVNAVAVAADGKTVASTSFLSSGPLLWDAATGKCQRVLEGQPFADGIAFSDDGKLLISTSEYPARVHFWEVATGKPVRTFALPFPKDVYGEHRHRVADFHLSADGKRLAALRCSSSVSVTFDFDCQLTLWDTATGKLLQTRSLPPESNPSFTPDGTGILMWKGNRLSVQDLATGQERMQFAGELANPLTFSADGKMMAAGKIRESSPFQPEGRGGAGYADEACLIELASGKEVLRFKTGAFLKRRAFSPDGRIFVGTHGEELWLWDTATGAFLFPPAPNTRYLVIRDGNDLTVLAFLPRGAGLVTGLTDGTLLIRDISHIRPKLLIEPNATDKQLESLWNDLADEDAAKAYLAAWKLSTIPTKTLPLLKKHVRPVAATDAKKVEGWIADLGREKLSVRESASEELAKRGLQIEPAARRALASKPSLEVRRRLDALLAEARLADRGIVRDRATLRTLRALVVLERIGTAEARSILQTLAGGAEGARATREAREALQRLERWHDRKKEESTAK
jgi:WD40 repeat protein